MVSRNPFRVRSSEYLEDERDFLSLFGLSALDIFNSEDVWTKIQIIRSARGGGKTSILRIFRPKTLNTIFESRTDDELKAIFQKLTDLDAFSQDGPKILGIHLSLFGNYSILSKLGFDERKRTSLFFALLTSRIILATLRSILELKKLDFPDGLKELEILSPSEPNIPTTIPIPCKGDELYKWASVLEQKISKIMEEDESEDSGLSGYESFSALHIIRARNILYRKQPVAERTLLMLDDVDKLTPEQRLQLSKTMVNLRIPIGIWLAERLEALRPEELLSPEGTMEREYGIPILLEKFWRSNPKKFVNLLSEIGDKRASWHRSYNITSFEHNLESTLGEQWNEKLTYAIKEESQRNGTKFGSKTEYRYWFDRCQNLEGDLLKIATNWRLLEIMIERDIRKKQSRLFEKDVRTEEEFTSKISSDENTVAEFDICRRYQIPYYYGFSNLVRISSSNVQQFLHIAGDLFEEMISARSLEKNTRISPERQEKIMEDSVEKRWDEINQSIPHSRYIIPFLDNVVKFCKIETNLPNAPYNAVTGIAISTRDVKRLQDDKILKSNNRYRILSEVISTCFAHNLLESLPDSKQGQKGSTHLIMYLNRLLCFRYKLPMSYGGWREQSLDTLCTFFENTFKPSRKEFIDQGKQSIIDWEKIKFE